jgi:hypothetical protein
MSEITFPAQVIAKKDAEIDWLRDENTRLRYATENARDEIERLRVDLAVMWHAWDSGNSPPHQVLKSAKKCYDNQPHLRALEGDDEDTGEAGIALHDRAT